MRLSRYIAQCGIASRRRAEELIAAGEIKVNGEIERQQGVQIDPERDRVVYKGRELKPEPHTYILLNKPKGYICTAQDEQGRPTVLDLLPASDWRLYPVGRLDHDTEGLLLLTNDGDFAHHLLHPRYQIEKHYQALV
ncbi:MAG: pseudouridine synthase, partial [Syntrophomonadaceae bacterium]|nr:pseudouridine synthase [Syntrophomonadaceae bacterium]